MFCIFSFDLFPRLENWGEKVSVKDAKFYKVLEEQVGVFVYKNYFGLYNTSILFVINLLFHY